jgi:hypothetical protein
MEQRCLPASLCSWLAELWLCWLDQRFSDWQSAVNLLAADLTPAGRRHAQKAYVGELC